MIFLFCLKQEYHAKEGISRRKTQASHFNVVFGLHCEQSIIIFKTIIIINKQGKMQKQKIHHTKSWTWRREMNEEKNDNARRLYFLKVCCILISFVVLFHHDHHWETRGVQSSLNAMKHLMMSGKNERAKQEVVERERGKRGRDRGEREASSWNTRICHWSFFADFTWCVFQVALPCDERRSHYRS